jgi:hypothetical protein
MNTPFRRDLGFFTNSGVQLQPPQRAWLFRFAFADVFWPLAKRNGGFLNRRRSFTSFYRNRSIFTEIRGNTDVGF